MKNEVVTAAKAGIALFAAQTVVTVVTELTGLRTCSFIGVALVGYLTVRFYSYLGK